MEHLAGHEREPSAGDRHDGVPDEADGGVGELQLDEALERRETVDVGRLDEFARDAFERGVEAEGHVPDGAGEEQDDGAELHADVAGGEEADHGEHDGRQEAEHGDRLHDVERSDHKGFDTLVVGGEVAVADGEEQAEDVGEEDANDRVERVLRQGAGVERDGHLFGGWAGPEHADAHDGVEDGEADGGDADIEEEGPTAFEGLRPGERFAAGDVRETFWELVGERH
jgi:hypothetical protein